MAQSGNPFNTTEFLQNYWQQSPLLIRNAFQLDDLISADELAGLALEDSIESRIIQHTPADNRWHLNHGPFTEENFSNLPESNWTLLVQAVDHWVPEVRAFLKEFNFLPQWRIDDIMISYATDGGGVGPHFDQYDVFLVQLEGKRSWETGQVCDENTDLVDQMPVKLLANFEQQDHWILEPGDVLYLPPALAHLGKSIGNSMTLSVGFRAPAENEIVGDLGHFLSSISSDFERYQDIQISNRETISHQIIEEDIQRIQTVLQKLVEDKSTLAHWFGQYMTEPKYDDSAVDTGDWSLPDFLAHWQQESLYRNPSSRLAFYENTLFVDGQAIETNLDEAILNSICDTEQFDFDALKDANSANVQHLLWSLSNLGAVFFER